MDREEEIMRWLASMPAESWAGISRDWSQKAVDCVRAMLSARVGGKPALFGVGGVTPGEAMALVLEAAEQVLRGGFDVVSLPVPEAADAALRRAAEAARNPSPN